MNCPRCNVPLAEARVEDVVLDRCGQCGGIWLDFAQLERVLSRESRALRDLVPVGARPIADSNDLTCPRCGDGLIRMRVPSEPVVYYACITCYGRWLDGSELGRLVGRPLSMKFEQLFQKLLGG